MIPWSHWKQILKGASERGLAVEITPQEAWSLFLGQGGRCALSGYPLVLKPQKGELRTASLDRIDSELGYVPGNCQWVHKDLNRLKSDWPLDHFLGMVRAIYEHQHRDQPLAVVAELPGDTPGNRSNRHSVAIETVVLERLLR